MVKDDNSKQPTVVLVNNPSGHVQVTPPCQTTERCNAAVGCVRDSNSEPSLDQALTTATVVRVCVHPPCACMCPLH